MMTAFQVKLGLSESRTRESIEAFFERYFDTFKGKYTIWELENNFEQTTPREINQYRNELLDIYASNIATKSDKEANTGGTDLNQIVAEISNEKPLGYKPAKRAGRKRKAKPLEQPVETL